MSRVALIFAVACSVALTLITITWSFAPTEWAQLDSNGVYVPQPIPFASTNVLVQIALWIGIVVGLWLSMVSDSQDRCRQSRRAFNHYLPLVTITLLGFGLRLYTLGDPPLIIDEIGFAARASDILHGQGIPLFAPGHNAMPITTSWLMAGAMSLFGQTAFVARLVPLCFATLSIPAIYLLGRTWWSRRTGLIAAVFLATFPTHIHFSRFALNNLIDPLFAMLALVFLARARRDGFRREYVIAGIFAGTAQYFYQGSRLLLMLMAVYWLFSWLKPRQSQWSAVNKKSKPFSTSREVAHFLCLILLIVLLSLPRFAPTFVAGLSISGNTRPIELPPDWQANALRSILAWINHPDLSPFWLSDAHLLELPALFVFAVGFWFALRKWRDERHIVVLLCLPLTTIFGGVIWASAPLYIRYMTATPAIALLVALGAVSLSRLKIPTIWSPVPNSDGRVGLKRVVSRNSVSALLIGFISVQGIYASIQHTTDSHDRITDSQWKEEAFGRQTANLPPEVAAVLVTSTPFDRTQWITIADYVAVYGQRRAVAINYDGGESLTRQLSRLGQTYQVIHLP